LYELINIYYIYLEQINKGKKGEKKKNSSAGGQDAWLA
jgi:hypothetical protein